MAPDPNPHYLQGVQVGWMLMHQIRPPEVGTRDPKLALFPRFLGHDFAILIQKTYF